MLRLFYPAVDAPIGAEPAIVRVASIGAKAALVGLVAFLVLRLRRRVGPEPWLEIGIVLLALPLLQPFAWIHHWVVALVCIPVVGRLIVLGRLSAAGTVVVLSGLAIVSTPGPAFAIGTSIAKGGGSVVALAAASWWLYGVVIVLLGMGLGARSTRAFAVASPAQLQADRGVG